MLCVLSQALGLAWTSSLLMQLLSIGCRHKDFLAAKRFLTCKLHVSLSPALALIPAAHKHWHRWKAVRFTALHIPRLERLLLKQKRAQRAFLSCDELSRF